MLKSAVMYEPFCLVWAPLRHTRMAHSFTLLYVSWRLSATFTHRHSGAAIPKTEKTSGWNVPCSTVITLWLYFRFFSFSLRSYSDDSGICIAARGLVTRMAKYALLLGESHTSFYLWGNLGCQIFELLFHFCKMPTFCVCSFIIPVHVCNWNSGRHQDRRQNNKS